MIVSLALAAWLSPANAGGFEAKTMRAPLSAVEVERPLVIGRGWFEFGFGADVKLGTGRWSDEGEIVPFASADWLHTTERLDLRYGLTRSSEVWMTLPYHYVRLTNDTLGTDTADHGIGEPRFGWKLEWLHDDAPNTSLVSNVSIKAPTGSEAPGTYIGGPNTVSSFVFSTGTTDLDVSVAGRRQFGAIAVTGTVGYTHRFSGVTQWVVETENQQFGGRFKPGSVAHASIEPMVQAGAVALTAGATYQARGVSKVGTTSEGIFYDRQLRTIEGSDGDSLDVSAGVILNVTRTLDVRGKASFPVMGEDLFLFPLESITPTYGPTYSGTVAYRF